MNHHKASISDGAYSNRLTGKISKNIIDFQEYANAESFLITNRYVNVTNYGLTGILPFTETFSPFYKLDSWEYSLTPPLKYRYNRYIYKKWVAKKHPMAAGSIYEKTGVKITPDLRDKLRIYRHGKTVTFEEAVGSFYRHMARKLNLKYKPSLKNMNPYEPWYLINDGLKTFFNKYFQETTPFLDNSPELKSDGTDLYNTGTALEKIQVLSLLSAVKIFIEGIDN